jgi:hypothetical protein
MNRVGMTAFCLAAALGFSARLQADTHTVRGVTFDSGSAVTTGAIVEGSYPDLVNGNPALYSSSSAFDFFEAPNTTVANHTASLFRSWRSGLYAPARSNVTLGYDPALVDPNHPFNATHLRDTLQLTWGGSLLGNTAGNDLAVFEQASQEAFAVRARVSGGSFTGWYFNIPGPRQDNDGTLSSSSGHGSATLFDLADLGVGDGAFIDMVELRNMRPEDNVSNAGGYGFVTFDAQLAGNKPHRTDGSLFPAGDFDPDIEYVVGLHHVLPPANTPEPGTLALLAANLLGLGGATLRRRRP